MRKISESERSSWRAGLACTKRKASVLNVTHTRSIQSPSKVVFFGMDLLFFQMFSTRSLPDTLVNPTDLGSIPSQVEPTFLLPLCLFPKFLSSTRISPHWSHCPGRSCCKSSVCCLLCLKIGDKVTTQPANGG